ncbi:hypothetical protein KGQ74_01940 [Patescibacteria group bacterium]|nr:hypothetical protein [Patescibacteria group bacterium]
MGKDIFAPSKEAFVALREKYTAFDVARIRKGRRERKRLRRTYHLNAFRCERLRQFFDPFTIPLWLSRIQVGHCLSLYDRMRPPDLSSNAENLEEMSAAIKEWEARPVPGTDPRFLELLSDLLADKRPVMRKLDREERAEERFLKFRTFLKSIKRKLFG